MGLYYNPIPPHMGAQQPLDQRKLTPPQSGPAPTNPPFPGARIAQAILSSWIIAAPMPVVARNLTPPSAPVAAPVLKRYDYTVHNAWIPAPPAAITPALVDPPISGPAPQNPPFAGARFPAELVVAWLPPAHIADPNFVGDTFAPWATAIVVPYLPIGTRVPAAVLSSWLPPAPQPILPTYVDPPISGPVPQNPPVNGTSVPLPVQVAWLPPPPTPVPAARNIAPTLPAPPAPYRPIGTMVPTAVHVSWLPPAPAPIVARLRNPPQSGPAPSQPPRIGARTPLPVSVWWIPPPPQPPTVRNGPIATVAVTGVLAATEQADTAQFIVDVRSDAPGILNFGRRVTINRW